MSTKITFSLDEINVLGSQGNVAMALQQFHQVDMLHYDKSEKEVGSLTMLGVYANVSCRESSGRIMTRVDRNRSYRYATSAEHISPASIMIDGLQTTLLERCLPFSYTCSNTIDAYGIPNDENGIEEDGRPISKGKDP